MLGLIWNNLLVSPILNVLVGLYKYTGSLGLSIIGLTVLIRTVLIPVVLPSVKNIQKQRDLQPQLDKLKKKYKNDKMKQAQAQMDLFKQHGINPSSGCLSQILMIIVLIALFNVIRLFTLNGDATAINEKLYFDSIKITSAQDIDTNFWYMDLSKPDPYFVLAILSGVLQFFASKMMIPYVERAEKVAEKTKPKSDDLAFQMQQQSLYMMPIMNVIIGVTLPAGVVLYIVATTIFTIIQNYFVSGWGGLKPWIKKLKFVNLTSTK